MTTFGREDDLRGATFRSADLRGARFSESWLSGVVMRGVSVEGADIDDPWLAGGSLLVNGVDVVPYVEAELDRRFPGRAQRTAEDPAGLRAAWEVLQQAWAGVLERVSGMPDGTVDVQVEEEWSFAETLRHLVLATDMWLRKAVHGVEEPFHPLGLMDGGSSAQHDQAPFTTTTPTWAEVLEVRADRVALVRDFLATLTPEQLDEQRPNPHDPEHQETVRSCVHTILEEEWEHLRYAVRDLDTLAAEAKAGL